MPRHHSENQRTFPAPRAALTLFGRTVTQLLALAVVVFSLYPLVESQSGDAAASPDGFVTAARDVERDDDDDDHDDDAEQTSRSATAVARADARAGKIAGRAAQAAQAAEKSAASAAAAGEAGSGTRGDTAAAVPPPPGPVSPGQGVGGALSWAPPAGFASYPLKRVTSATALTSVDGGGSDVRIELSPAHPVGPIVIKNCRNAVLIGGEITVLASANVDGADQRAIYVRNCTGTVHIEGVQINGHVAGSQSDGIAVNAPNAVVQIQNVRVDGLRGTLSGNHADVFQPWGGVKEFRIDRLTGSSNYQGLHIKEGLGPIGRGTIRNANIASSEVGPTEKGGQFLYMDCNGYPLALDNVYIDGRSGRAFGTSIWPKQSGGDCPAVISSGTAVWPGYTSLTGSVREGRPASDFVPAGSVGRGYVSVGYR